ncbi:hypothetical protein [uncultured Clostridium sp.]|uniref:hypothetical protein n=1 Tax=uncultured Clostridium sp. TaxID=59620 RepID=UPI003217770A
MTPYTNIFKRFSRKIKQDKSFFFYESITEEETLQIINQRSLDLLNDSIVEFQPQIAINQNVNMLDKDDDLQVFNFNLIPTEEDLISDLMVIKLFEEQSIRLKELQKYLGNDIKPFSPNEERKTFMDMLDEKQNKFEIKVALYNSIDRNTGKFLLAY